MQILLKSTEDNMSFEDFIVTSFGEEPQQGETYIKSKLVERYLEIEKEEEKKFSYFRVGYFSLEKGQVLCTINNMTVPVEEKLAKSIEKAISGSSNAASELWQIINSESQPGLFFVYLYDEKYYFCYGSHLKAYMGMIISNFIYSEIPNNSPVLNAIMDLEIERFLSKEMSFADYDMIDTVSIISKVLSLKGLPNIELIQSLASMKYEGRINEGSIYFLDKKVDSNNKITFNDPQPIVYSEIRALRKYLQMVGENMTLKAKFFGIEKNGKFSGVWLIKGIGYCNETAARGKLYFLPSSGWKLILQNDEVGYVSGHFYAKNCNRIKLDLMDDLDSICTKKEKEMFHKIINLLMKQKHGTMLVISSIADEEADRLKQNKRAIIPENCFLSDLSDAEMLAVSSIDGCIIANPQGKCSAIGAILDGNASIPTDIARGARYNAAMTYINQLKIQRKKAVAIIISEDGSVDMVSTESIKEKTTFLDKVQENARMMKRKNE